MNEIKEVSCFLTLNSLIRKGKKNIRLATMFVSTRSDHKSTCKCFTQSWIKRYHNGYGSPAARFVARSRDDRVIGTLSSGDADGDGNAKTCERAGERTRLCREYTNIKQHRRKPRFPHCQAYWHYRYSSSVYQDELGSLHWKKFAINSWQSTMKVC